MTNDEIIDIVLKRLYELNTSPIHDIIHKHFTSIGNDMNGFTETKKRIKEIMYHEGLIANLEEHITITHLGKTIVEKNRGWLNYLADKAREKQIQDELIQSSIRTNKLQKALLWITVGLTAITLFISVLDYLVHREELRLEQNRLPQKGEELQHLEQNTKTVRPNSDSLANSLSDSLHKNLKFDKQVKKK